MDDRIETLMRELRDICIRRGCCIMANGGEVKIVLGDHHYETRMICKEQFSVDQIVRTEVIRGH